MHWEPVNTDKLLRGVIVAGIFGWFLLCAFTEGRIRTRRETVRRKQSPKLFWCCTSIVAFTFGVIGVPFFFMGLGAPAIPAFALGFATAVGALVVIARKWVGHHR